jgi:hypothetical protein
MTAHPMASWFETRGVAALTMRVGEDLILRPLGRVSKDDAIALETARPEAATRPALRRLATVPAAASQG